MTNIVAISLAALIAAVVSLDLFVGWGGTMFVVRKFYDLMNYVIFWR